MRRNKYVWALSIELFQEQIHGTELINILEIYSDEKKAEERYKELENDYEFIDAYLSKPLKIRVNEKVIVNE